MQTDRERAATGDSTMTRGSIAVTLREVATPKLRPSESGCNTKIRPRKNKHSRVDVFCFLKRACSEERAGGRKLSRPVRRLASGVASQFGSGLNVQDRSAPEQVLTRKSLSYDPTCSVQSGWVESAAQVCSGCTCSRSGSSRGAGRECCSSVPPGPMTTAYAACGCTTEIGRDSPR